MSTSVLIQPSFGNPQARKNCSKTLAQPFPFDKGALRSALTVAEYEHLSGLHPDGSARFWATPRNQDKIMSRLKHGDVVLFTGKNHVKAIGEVGAIFRNADAGDAMRPPQETHGPYLNVYSLISLQETEIPYPICVSSPTPRTPRAGTTTWAPGSTTRTGQRGSSTVC